MKKYLSCLKIFDKTVGCTILTMRWSVVTLVLAVVWLGSVAGARARRVHRDRRSARNPVPGANIQGKRGLAEMVAALLPNTFYSRPKFRYPYYHKDGKEIIWFSCRSDNYFMSFCSHWFDLSCLVIELSKQQKTLPAMLHSA